MYSLESVFRKKNCQKKKDCPSKEFSFQCVTSFLLTTAWWYQISIPITENFSYADCVKVVSRYLFTVRAYLIPVYWYCYLLKSGYRYQYQYFRRKYYELNVSLHHTQLKHLRAVTRKVYFWRGVGYEKTTCIVHIYVYVNSLYPSNR